MTLSTPVTPTEKQLSNASSVHVNNNDTINIEAASARKSLNPSLPTSNHSTQTTQLQQLHVNEQDLKRLQWYSFFKGRAFNISAIVLFIIAHLIFAIPCFFLFFLVSGNSCLFYAFFVTGISAIIYGLASFVIFIRLIRLQLTENYHIVRAIIINLVLVLLALITVLYYAVVVAASAFVTNYNVGLGVYWTFLAIDVILLSLMFIDVVMYVFIYFLSLLLWYIRSSAIPLVHTFFWSVPVQPSEDTELVQLIRDKDFAPHFKNFAAKEWSLENYMFYESWLQVKEASEHLDPEQYVEIFKHLYKLFFAPYATLGLNVSSEIHQQWDQAIENPELAGDECKLVLENTIPAIKFNLLDTYTRFKKTKEFEEWKTASNVRRKTISTLGWEESAKIKERKSSVFSQSTPPLQRKSMKHQPEIVPLAGSD